MYPIGFSRTELLRGNLDVEEWFCELHDKLGKPLFQLLFPFSRLEIAGIKDYPPISNVPIQEEKLNS